jgi:hypothetical protein
MKKTITLFLGMILALSLVSAYETEYLNKDLFKFDLEDWSFDNGEVQINTDISFPNGNTFSEPYYTQNRLQARPSFKFNVQNRFEARQLRKNGLEVNYKVDAFRDITYEDLKYRVIKFSDAIGLDYKRTFCNLYNSKNQNYMQIVAPLTEYQLEEGNLLINAKFDFSNTEYRVNRNSYIVCTMDVIDYNVCKSLPTQLCNPDPYIITLPKV